MSTQIETDTRRQEGLRHKESLDTPYQFGVFAHFYQPPRFIVKPDGTHTEVIQSVNHDIYEQCYERMLAKPKDFPKGFGFSFYSGNRELMKKDYPEGYAVAIDNIQRMEDNEFNVFGDPFFHDILPLLPLVDQEILIGAGKEAFFQDFGFDPKGLWLPETAVTTNTLEIAARNGYEFVPLRNNQIETSSTDPVIVSLPNGEEIVIIPFDSGISGALSYDPWARMNGDNFFSHYIPDRANPNGKTRIVASDGELYGHHDPQGDKFLDYLLRSEVLARHGYKPLSIKKQLDNASEYAKIIEFSSWSDKNHHRLGRWRGECCGNTTAEGRYLFRELQDQNDLINFCLNEYNPNWTEKFIPLIVELRNEILAGGNIMGRLENSVRNATELRFYAAKIYALLGFTSCGWFFDGPQRPEREIPRQLTVVVEKILQNEN